MGFTYQDLGQSPTSSGTAPFEDLFLPVAAGEVLLSYENKVLLDSRILSKPAKMGAKSVQFDMIGDASTVWREIGVSVFDDQPATGNATPSAYAQGRSLSQPGDFIETINQGKREVFLDRPLMAGPVMIDSFQEKLSTLANGGRDPIFHKLGQAIAEDSDILGFQLLLKATAPTSAGGFNWGSLQSPAVDIPIEFLPLDSSGNIDPGHNWRVNANAATDGSALLEEMRQIVVYWDEQNVPDEGRTFFIRPAQYYLLVQNQDLLNRDFGGANGIYSEGTVYKAWGVPLVKTNLLPQKDYSGSGSTPLPGTDRYWVRNPIGYDFDSSNVVCLAVQRDAAVKARSAGMSLSSKDYQFERHADGLLAEMAFGFDVFRPRGLGAIATA